MDVLAWSGASYELAEPSWFAAERERGITPPRSPPSTPARRALLPLLLRTNLRGDVSLASAVPHRVTVTWALRAPGQLYAGQADRNRGRVRRPPAKGKAAKHLTSEGVGVK